MAVSQSPRFSIITSICWFPSQLGRAQPFCRHFYKNERRKQSEVVIGKIMGLNMAELKSHIKDQLGGIFSSSPHPAPGGGVLPPPTFMSPIVSEGEKQKGKGGKKKWCPRKDL